MENLYTNDELHAILRFLSSMGVVQTGLIVSLTDDGFVYDTGADCETAYKVLDDDGDTWFLLVGKERLWCLD